MTFLFLSGTDYATTFNEISISKQIYLIRGFYAGK